jgi:predicted metal-dependent peptidase
LNEDLKLITSVKRHLMTRYPFFGIIALNLEWIKVRDDDPIIRTAATDGFKVYWNAAFMKLLDFQGKVFVAAHEVGHCLVLTMDRRGNRDPFIWNLASDYALNAMLKIYGMALPILKTDLMIGSKKPVVLYDAKYEGLLAEEIYELLLKENTGGMSFLDEHIESKKKFETDENGFIKEVSASGSEISKNKRKIKSLFNQAKVSAGGNMSAGLKRLIEELNEPKIDWKSVLAARISSVKYGDYEWCPPDPGLFGSGISIPQINMEYQLKVTVVVDTSGSISDDDLKNVLSEIDSIAKEFNSWEIKVFSFDTEVHNVKTYNQDQSDELLKHSMVGGGGTSFDAPLEYLHKDNFKPSLVVFFTDGYTGDGWNQQKDLDVLWIINSDVRAPWGETIKYDRYA